MSLSKSARAVRVEVPGTGPCVAAIKDGMLLDMTHLYPTMRDLCESANPAGAVRKASGPLIATYADAESNADPSKRNGKRPWLLSPIDLQAVKAAGVTFAISMLERVIEEKARGDAKAATAIRAKVTELVGDDLRKLKPGSPEAMKLKETLVREGAWSQYLEVGIGPDAEIFTKCQAMATVGTQMEVGIHPASSWNNPEPEVVLVINSKGSIVGATLGNDVNLRDVEGRSALLLGKAKDNNASASLGPAIRFVDDDFTLDTIRNLKLSLTVVGQDGFKLEGSSSMQMISRDPADLAAQAINRHHHYPDGLVLYCGTMFAPVDDRGEKGQGFTHKLGDIVTIATPELGALQNRVVRTDEAAPWSFGTRDLMANLAKRKLL